MKYAPINAFLSALALFAAASFGAMPVGKPNVILIYSDDHGYADLGAQGADQDIRTPHLDALARDGETRNLLAQHADIAERLHARLKAWDATLKTPGLPTETHPQDQAFFAVHVDKNPAARAARDAFYPSLFRQSALLPQPARASSAGSTPRGSASPRRSATCPR